MDFSHIERRKDVSLELLLQTVDAYGNAGKEGLTRRQLSRLLHRDLKTVDRIRKALKLHGAVFAEARNASPDRETVARMTRPPTWAKPMDGVTCLAMQTAREGLARAGSADLAAELFDFEKHLVDSLLATQQHGWARLKSVLQVRGGVDEDPTEQYSANLKALLEAFQRPHSVLVELTLGGRRLRVCPHGLILDVQACGLFFLGLNLEDEPGMVFCRVSDLESVLVSDHHARIPAEWRERLERAATFELGGYISLKEPFEVTLQILDPGLLKDWAFAQPALPGFELDPDRGEARFQANHLGGPAAWVLSLAGRVEVLRPARLRTQVRKLAEKVGQQTARPAPAQGLF